MTVKQCVSIFGILLFSIFSTISKAEEGYVGSQVCADCHQQEYKNWQGSHHDMSMRHADGESVLGKFNDTSILFNNEKSRFFMKNEQYWVNIKGPDGKFHDYQIKYTFGYFPLQQYMVEFADGRIQLIPFAWDARTAKEGGQRWFHLYPEFTDSREEFFWTNTGQNWNYMCSDCHSTNVSKNFDLKTNSYNTTYSEINVGCEACHGAGTGHLEWLKAKTDTGINKGFSRELGKTVSQWIAREGKNTLFPEDIKPTQQTLVCAQCHSRHVQISENDFVESNAFGDKYMLSLINGNQYHADGQIYDEVFVYGSFLQSEMNRNGVVCTNCHEPHSNNLIIPKEAVCLQCHQADTYASSSHHKHKDNSSGAQCVNCHMPETTFMQIDARRDHGWHVPRSNLANKLGTPDTCLSCHSEKDSHWSASQLASWYPNSEYQKEEHFAPVFSAIDNGYLEASRALSHVAQNKANAPIIRASAIERMAPMSDKNSLIAIARGAKDPDEFIRMASARGSASIQLNERWRIIAPLLEDSVLAVRIEAAYSFVSLWPDLTDKQKKRIKPALDEYMMAQEFNSDRGFSHNNKGSVFAQLGQSKEAEQAFLTSIKIEPNSAQAYVNLAELYRRMGKGENSSVDILNRGLKNVPRNAAIPYALGLAYIRSGNAAEAIRYFSLAVERAPNNPQYNYVLGLSLEHTDVNKAQIALRNAYSLSGDPRQLFALCEMQVKHAEFHAQKCINELSLIAPPQVIEQLKKQLLKNKSN